MSDSQPDNLGAATASQQSGQRKSPGLLLHLHPAKLPQAALSFNRTWGLGGMALVLFCLLTFTGILLMLVYEPTVAEAYHSIAVLQQQILFGRWMRNVHHWSGNLLVVITFLHLLRVFFTGGFVAVRKSNWWFGLALLLSVCAAVFTGYLLPWDQLSYWAITICTGMFEYVPLFGTQLQLLARGGAELGDVALRNYFTLHTSLLPVLMVILMGFHFWRVRKARGVILPEAVKSKQDLVPTNPNLVVREVTVGLWLLALVCLFSVFVDAPLQSIANPGMSPNPAKAPWYFMGIQELLLHFSPLVAVVMIPGLVSVGLIVLPYTEIATAEEGAWFRSDKGRKLSIAAALLGLILTPLTVLFSDLVYQGGAIFKGANLLTGGLLPLGTILVGLIVAYLLLRKRWQTSSGEAVQTVFVFLLVAFVVLTVVGIWWRGPGMVLIGIGGS